MVGAVAAVAALLAAATPAQAAQARATIAPGIYGNVRMGAETGDLGGMEIEIHPDGGTVETTYCEGWCNMIYRTRYADHGGWIDYAYQESATFAFTVRVRQRGRDVVVEQRFLPVDGKARVARFRLKRLKDRFGLDVAEQWMRESREPTATP